MQPGEAPPSSGGSPATSPRPPPAVAQGQQQLGFRNQVSLGSLWSAPPWRWDSNFFCVVWGFEVFSTAACARRDWWGTVGCGRWDLGKNPDACGEKAALFYAPFPKQ
jgi:hypothetical protein